MATTTPKLGLPRPEGTDNVTRANNNDLIDAIDENAASQADLDSHVSDKSNPHGVTPAQIGAETPAGAQAKADAAEQAAKAYADQKVAGIPSPPVTSVNSKTGAVVLAKSDVGLGNVDNVKQATKTEFDAHVANKNNPHGVTKAQIGLGSVQNYGIASQAQAQAGTANNVYMTPLRTKEAITAQTGGVLWRINNGRPEYNDGTGWKLVGANAIVASNTVQHEFLTVRDAGTPGVSRSILLAKFALPAPGEFVVELEGRASGSSLDGAPTISISPARQYNTGTNGNGLSLTYTESDWDYRTPVGTVLGNSAPLPWRHNFTRTQAHLLFGQNGQFKLTSEVFYTDRATPFYIYMGQPGSSASSSFSVRNVRVKYDIL